MTVDVLRWEGLLEGEEVAHLGTEPAREAPFATVPASSTLASARRSA